MAWPTPRHGTAPRVPVGTGRIPGRRAESPPREVWGLTGLLDQGVDQFFRCGAEPNEPTDRRCPDPNALTLVNTDDHRASTLNYIRFPHFRHPARRRRVCRDNRQGSQIRLAKQGQCGAVRVDSARGDDGRTLAMYPSDTILKRSVYHSTHWELSMVTRRSRKSATLAVKSAELALAVPQVVAHRVARMALAGPSPSDRDRREFQLMVSEKQAAFAQAWTAMGMESFRASQAIATSMFGAFFNPFSRNKSSAAVIATTVQNAAVGVLEKGLAPVHRKAVSNAKRLARTKPR